MNFLCLQSLQFIYFFDIDWSHILLSIYYTGFKILFVVFFIIILEQEYVSENFDPQYYCYYLFSLEFMNELYIFCSDKCSFYLYMSWITTNLYAHKNMNTIIYMHYTRIYQINLKFILICSFCQFYVGIIFILCVFSDNFIFF